MMAVSIALPTQAAEKWANPDDAPAPHMPRDQATDASKDVAAFLRAIANLIEACDSANLSPNTLHDQLTAPLKDRNRTTTSIGLEHGSAADEATSLRRFLAVESSVNGRDTEFGDVLLIPDEESNVLLVSGTKEHVGEILKLVRQIDAPPPMVLLQVLIAEQLPEDKTDAQQAHAPDINKHGDAWLAWAQKQGIVRIVSRPRITALNNQSGMIQIGASSDTQDQTSLPNIRLGVTPHITDQGSVVIEMGAEISTTSRGRAGAIRKRVIAETTALANVGETVVVSGLILDAGKPELLIAITPTIHR
jgi:type II secretory pathway component GspD/PulD (secretin)